jgi:hypothetical protein
MAQGNASRRPTKVMMLAVNAAIDGNHDEVDRLVDEYKLDRKELQHRISNRGDLKYDMSPRKKSEARAPGRAMRPARPAAVDLTVTVNGRTSVRQLFKLIEQADRIKGEAQQELKRRPAEQLEPVKKALSEIELLRREREKIERRIHEAEEALG